MALQTVIKLYQPLEKNIPLRSNYLFIILKLLCLKLKALNTRHIFRNSVINETGNVENETEQYLEISLTT